MAAQTLTLRIEDFAAAPISGQISGGGNPAYLARINFLREEPGDSGRFFVNDLNGNLYTLDKTTREFTSYLNFNGNGANPGLFDRFTTSSGYANGLVTFQFDPKYATNGVFYTVHIEDPALSGSLLPNNASAPGFDTSGYTNSGVINTPGSTSTERQAVLIKWTDTNIADNAFTGTAKEIMRVDYTSRIHPMGDLIFNPTAKPGDADYRMLYIASGDGGSGETNNATLHSNPQNNATLAGKILRIDPDGSNSINGRYGIPVDNPYAGAGSGVRREIFASGFRNPHRLSWDVDPENPASNHLITNDIGFHAWEEVNIVRAGGNYGWADREGNQAFNVSNGTTGPLPANDATLGYTYPVIQYPHAAEYGDAISSGFVYRGSNIPELYGKYVFGDITTGYLFYSDFAEMLAADDGDPNTFASIHRINLLWDSPHDAADSEEFSRMFEIVEEAYHARGGLDGDLPGGATISGTGRADIRLAVDAEGELYILSKSDGMIRQIVAVPEPTTLAALVMGLVVLALRLSRKCGGREKNSPRPTP